MQCMIDTTQHKLVCFESNPGQIIRYDLNDSEKISKGQEEADVDDENGGYGRGGTLVRFKEDRDQGTRKQVKSMESWNSGHTPTRTCSKYSVYSRATNPSLYSNGSIISMSMNGFSALVVLKIIFFDIAVSLGDAITDILQGVNLIVKRGGWDVNETWLYGVGVLIVCWVPGLVCVLHILSHYRSVSPDIFTSDK